jgi:methylthioribose-1-phosphate isomerase
VTLERPRTIEWSDDAIVIIDQRALPQELTLRTIREVPELIEAIRTLAVRGAMALGVAGAMGMALAARRASERGERLDGVLDRAAEQLGASRPTAVNLSWGIARALAVRSGGPEAILAEALRVRDEDIEANRRIADAGAQILRGRSRPLTHCNAGALAGVEWGTALAVVRAMRDRGDLRHVFVSETRPLLQGARLTTWELAGLGIPHSLIVDGAGASVLLSGQADCVIVGADRIAANGDVANKIGTLAHALAAARAGVPFVVAAPESTIDAATPDGRGIRIEERDPDEVTSVLGRRVAPAATTALNLAFDVTPADLVTAIVTERRVIRPGSDPVAAP